jgi:hypothetical protein
MTAGILAILQGTLTLSLSVTGYYATLTCIFPVAVLSLRFFIPTKEPLSKQDKSKARDVEVYVCEQQSVHNPNKSLLIHDFSSSGSGSGSGSDDRGGGSGSVYREEILFVRVYFPLLSLQLLNSSLAYG